VLQTEIGARISELMAIQVGGERRDIDDERGRVRLFGKAKRFGGKRIRWVELSELAAEVLSVFERVFLPMFPQAQTGHLFPNADGSPLTTAQYGKALKTVIKMSTKRGVPVPEELTSHDLRRTCATNTLEKNPSAYRKVLKMLGHSYPSSAAPYLIATDDDVEEAQSDLIDIFVDPHIIKRGTNR
jgi:integrase